MLYSFTIVCRFFWSFCIMYNFSKSRASHAEPLMQYIHSLYLGFLLFDVSYTSSLSLSFSLYRLSSYISFLLTSLLYTRVSPIYTKNQICTNVIYFLLPEFFYIKPKFTLYVVVACSWCMFEKKKTFTLHLSERNEKISVKLHNK